MDYNLFISDPAMWWLNIFISLLITLVAYGAGPVLYSSKKRTPVSRGKVRAFCIVYTAVVAAVFIALRSGTGPTTTTPALLWGTVFYGSALNRLKKRDLLIGQPNQEPSKHAEVEQITTPHHANECKRPVELHESQLDKKTFSKVEQTFTQQEQNEEAKRVYGPLDPPEKRVPRSAPLWLSVCLSILLVGALVVCWVLVSANTSKSALLSDQLEAAQSDYQSLHSKYNKLSSEYADLMAKYSRLELSYEDASYCQFMMTVFVGITVERDNEAYFHTFLCEEYEKNTGQFWIMPTTVFADVGITPCPKCHTAKEIDLIYACLT